MRPTSSLAELGSHPSWASQDLRKKQYGGEGEGAAGAEHLPKVSEHLRQELARAMAIDEKMDANHVRSQVSWLQGTR
jgi:hypothetical protein